MKSSIKNQFHIYYGLSDSQKSNIWKSCVFVLDTNVLLDLYRYTDETKNEMLKVLVGLKTRLWAPHQVGLEYSRRRPSVILEQRSLIEKTSSILNLLCKKIEDEFRENLQFRDHPYIDKSAIVSEIQSCINGVKVRLEDQIAEYPHGFNEDSILEKLEEIFEGSVGSPFEQDELKDIFLEGESRYQQKIPPGFADSTKEPKEERFGDLLIWKQILKHSMENSCHIVFVTSDNKEDWWWKEKGRRLGPHPQLVAEFKETTGKNFLIYNPDSFLDQAKSRLKVSLKRGSIDEVKRVALNKYKRNKLDHLNTFSKPVGFSHAVDAITQANIASNFLSDSRPGILNQLAKTEKLRASINDNLKTLKSPNSALARSLLEAREKCEADRNALIARYAAENFAAEVMSNQQEKFDLLSKQYSNIFETRSATEELKNFVNSSNIELMLSDQSAINTMRKSLGIISDESNDQLTNEFADLDKDSSDTDDNG